MTSSLLTTTTLTSTLLIDIMQCDIKPTIPPPHPPTNTGTYTQTHTHILKWRQNFMLKPNTCKCIPINRHRFYMQPASELESLWQFFFSAQRPSANMEEFLAWDCSLLPVYLKIYIHTFVHYLLTIGYFKGKNAHFNIKLCLISQWIF